MALIVVTKEIAGCQLGPNLVTYVYVDMSGNSRMSLENYTRPCLECKG